MHASARLRQKLFGFGLLTTLRCGCAQRVRVSWTRRARELLCVCVDGQEKPVQGAQREASHPAQDRALLRAANMTEVQLTVEGAEHAVVDVLLEDLTSLRRTFYARVENVTARAQSTRGSRKAGQDSDDELSAGDLDQDDEE